ncbi:MAG: putative methyltransferase [Gammaproteobacteria bacterium]|jgi:predicted methyltransferase
MKQNFSAKRSLYLVAFVLLSITCSPTHGDVLDDVLAAQSGQVQARYSSRHPKETLSLFGIEAGMTVIEAFPGGGWYTDILLPFLGPKGQLIGADYAFDMYPKFNFYGEDYLAAKKTWAKTWTESAMRRHGHLGAKIGAFPLGSMTADVDGKADAVLLIRALHNLARFENDGGYLSTALKEIHRALKPGGVVGVVQHIAPEEAPDSWADGSNGYLKKSFVVSTMNSAGFELVSDSDINLNPADKPQEGDIVWRLSPAFATSRNDENLRNQLREIGESTRMTLLFRKSN